MPKNRDYQAFNSICQTSRKFSSWVAVRQYQIRLYFMFMGSDRC
ncbi:hypothetical protein N44_01170 [Microcystis aeruginosa NIES-44]|uniref:Uncharacterized protein n=1 Tax=Microcystis aeruginosa NIES-44 TaxID=449439 RepID=A0A0A1VS08_MICAE|nr:hypothetical protein N44_01170 [Microcystis aeruginosa NIES-44]